MSYLMLRILEEDEYIMLTEQEKKDGSPAHIVSKDGFINIKFQLGPIKEVGVNGTQIDSVIDVVINRLEGFQKGPFECMENLNAITHLMEAKNALQSRTKKREDQGVEGLDEKHVS